MNASQDGPSGTWQVTGPGQRTIAYVAGQSYPDTSPGAAGPPLTAGARGVDAVGGADDLVRAPAVPVVAVRVPPACLLQRPQGGRDHALAQ